jgi:hypothetical protein
MSEEECYEALNDHMHLLDWVSQEWRLVKQTIMRNEASVHGGGIVYH